MSRSEDIFERVVAQGETAIDGFINDRQSEELYLDFKQSTDRGAGAKLHQTDRNNLSKAIGGFGNSEGGVIVWGVDCRNLPALGDVANAKFPINTPGRFKSWLEGVVSGCTVPAHPTIRHHAIETAAGNGFVITHVPMSNLAPHQCVPDLKFYMRAGSDFSPVPHAVLAGMFGRRPQPSLFHNWLSERPRFEPGRRPNDPLLEFHAQIVLHNAGPGIARDIYLNIELWPPGPNSRMVATVVSNEWAHEEIAGMIVSTMSKESFRLGPLGATAPLTLSFELAGPFERALTCKISYGCTGAPGKLIERSAEPNQLDALLRSTMVPTGKIVAEALLPR